MNKPVNQGGAPLIGLKMNSIGKKFRSQCICKKIFLFFGLVLFVFSLCFMTDFQALFGLKMKVNQSIARFHDIDLQSYTRFMFSFSLFTLIVSIVATILETGKKVPDSFALIILTILLIIVSIIAFILIAKVPSLIKTYLSLDFSNVPKEGGGNYIVRMRGFYLSIIINLFVALSSIVFIVALWLSHIAFLYQGRS